MAPRFPRRRGDADEPTEGGSTDGDDDVDLGATEHAWWAQRDINDPWEPHPRRDLPPEESPERDVIAEHLGSDWRSDFGFDPVLDAPREVRHESQPRSEPTPKRHPAPPPEPEPEPTPEQPIDSSDPYAMLGVEPTATWEEIVQTHREQARRNHPDQLFGRPDEEIAAAEERIRDINVAYQELRIRRGK